MGIVVSPFPLNAHAGLGDFEMDDLGNYFHVDVGPRGHVVWSPTISAGRNLLDLLRGQPSPAPGGRDYEMSLIWSAGRLRWRSDGILIGRWVAKTVYQETGDASSPVDYEHRRIVVLPIPLAVRGGPVRANTWRATMRRATLPEV